MQNKVEEIPETAATATADALSQYGMQERDAKCGGEWTRGGELCLLLLYVLAEK